MAFNILNGNKLHKINISVAVDKEEFREDKAVKVTRKELNGLVASLVEFEDMYEPRQISRKKKSWDNSTVPLQSTTMVICQINN